MRTLGWCLALMVTLGLIMASPASAQDRTEADRCAGCHFYPGNVVMPFVVGETDPATGWYLSEHANSYSDNNGNTYCAKCHSPFQADPDATHGSNDPVPSEYWEAVTCSSCHPPHDLRVAWGTPIGNYDIQEGDWFPVYDANALCTYCHTGARHEKDFQGYGDVMYHKKGVRCIDCHMAEVPNDLDPPDRYTRTHDFKVATNVPYSCGTVEGGCHANHKEEWAIKQIHKEKMHGKH